MTALMARARPVGDLVTVPSALGQQNPSRGNTGRRRDRRPAPDGHARASVAPRRREKMVAVAARQPLGVGVVEGQGVEGEMVGRQRQSRPQCGLPRATEPPGRSYSRSRLTEPMPAARASATAAATSSGSGADPGAAARRRRGSGPRTRYASLQLGGTRLDRHDLPTRGWPPALLRHRVRGQSVLERGPSAARATPRGRATGCRRRSRRSARWCGGRLKQPDRTARPAHRRAAPAHGRPLHTAAPCALAARGRRRRRTRRSRSTDSEPRRTAGGDTGRRAALASSPEEGSRIARRGALLGTDARSRPLARDEGAAVHCPGAAWRPCPEPMRKGSLGAEPAVLPRTEARFSPREQRLALGHRA